ncbi:MAG TPA: TrkA family potassium uptake protein [Acidimicrobiales bacterium]|nr:TrkA family potassium uptake protein [Acidimicrobiales bacterium]
MRVVIAGGGNVGTHIADDLSRADHEVVIIERDERMVERTASRHPVTWVVGDACEVRTLQRVGLETCDVLVAATGDDEDNLVVSLLARQEFAVPKVVARVNHPGNEWLFNQSWGVDVSVSAPHLLTSLVTEAVSVGSLVRLLELEGGGVRIIEVTLADTSPAADRTLMELDLPRDATVVAVVRQGHVVVPGGDTVLLRGDEVLVLVTTESEPLVQRLLVG